MDVDHTEACDGLRPSNAVNTPSVSRYVAEDIDDGFMITNVVDRRVIQFEFDVTWRVRQDTVGGWCEARWELTRGPAFISRNRGWLRITEAHTGGSLLEIQHELAAPRVKPDKPAG